MFSWMLLHPRYYLHRQGGGCVIQSQFTSSTCPLSTWAQEIAKQVAEQKKQERRPKALPGWEKPEAAPKASASTAGSKGSVRRLPAELVAEVAAQMSGSMGSLNSLVWQLEGIREVIQVSWRGLLVGGDSGE